MAKKHKTLRFALPFLFVMGVGTVVIFYFIFGGLMTLRYLLGAIMFGTFTISIIAILGKRYGKRKIQVRI